MAIREKIVVTGDTRDATRALDKAGSSFDRMGDNVRRAAGAVGLGIGIAQLGRAGAAAVKLAIDAEEAASAFATSFGPATERMSGFVDEFANKAGFASFELEQMLAVTGSVVQGLGASEEASASLSQRMAILAGDVASFSNASGGAEAVLQALQSAINGEREALKTYGIAVAESEVQQRALLDTGKERADQLTRLEKGEATIALAYEKASKALGDLDRTQDSAANRLRALGGASREAAADIGEGLLPALESALPLLESVAQRAGGAGDILADTFDGFRVIGNSFTNVSRGLETITAEVFTFGLANTEASRKAADLAAASNDVINILREVRYGRLSRDANGYASAVQDLVGKNTLFRESLEDVTDGFGISSEAQFSALRTLVEYGETHGWAADQVQLLREMLGEVTVAAGQTAAPTEDAFYRMRQAAQGWQGEVDEAIDQVPEWRMAMQEMIRANHEAGRSFVEDLAGDISGFVTFFEGAVEEIDESLDELESQFEERLGQQHRFYSNLAVLAAQGLDDLVAELEAQGPAVAGTAEALAQDMDRAMDWERRIEEQKRQAEIWAQAIENGLAGEDQKMAQVLYRYGIDWGRSWRQGFDAGIGNLTFDQAIDRAPGALGGGTVPGSGPRAFARGGRAPHTGLHFLHGGEVILNAAQQENVASQLQGPGSISFGDIIVTVSGQADGDRIARQTARAVHDAVAEFMS